MEITIANDVRMDIDVLFERLCEAIATEELSHYYAKGKGRGTHDTTAWQSLRNHLKAVATKAQQLIEIGVLPDGTMEIVAGKGQTVYKKHPALIVLLAAFFHDMGKCNEQFQKRVKSQKKTYFNSAEELPHNYLSIFCTRQAIDGVYALEDAEWQDLVYAIAHHHFLFDDMAKRIDKSAVLEEVKEKFLQQFCARATKVKKRTLRDGLDRTNVKIPIEIWNYRDYITGLLMLCDYAASGDREVAYANEFLEETMEHVVTTWREKNPNAEWNDLQRYCKDHRNANVMITGETGMGKTEGALLWIGNEKGLFFLPLRTAINAIHNRVVEYVTAYYRSKGYEDYRQRVHESTSLLHSTGLYHLMKTEVEESQEVDMAASNASELFYELLEWRERAKQFSLPLIISTVDQLFDFVFRLKGYQRKMATVAISKVVIDEIQMYDPRLLAYLIYGLECAVQLGGKVAIITATMPPFIRDLLVQHIPFDGVDTEPGRIVDGRRQLHALGNPSFFKAKPPRHSVCIRPCKISAEDILTCYRRNETKGNSNKILVICNTIADAQRMYIALRQEVGEAVSIFHSRFTGVDRAKKESQIMSFGRTAHSGSGIWVTTSICEASLDIDFDVLFTELSYITSLLQRLGRCNRKGNKPIDVCNCYIYTDIEDAYLTESYESGDRKKGFIDRDLYEASKEVLLPLVDDTMDPCSIGACAGIPVTEEEKLAWIETALTMDRVKDSRFMKAYRQEYSAIRNGELAIVKSTNDTPDVVMARKLRDIDSIDVIPEKEILCHDSLDTDTYAAMEAAKEVLNDGNASAADKERARQTIQQHTVSVPGSIRYPRKDGTLAISKLCYEVTPYWKIPRTTLYYDNTIGLIMKDDIASAYEAMLYHTDDWVQMAQKRGVGKGR